MNDEYHSETAVIGCLLLQSDSFNEIGDVLTPEDFCIALHKDVYKAISDMISLGEPVDMLTVDARLKKASLSQQSCFSELCEIARVPFVIENIKFYANDVKKLSTGRKVIKAAQDVIVSVHSKEDDILDKAQQRFSSLADLNCTNIILTSDRLKNIIEVLDNRISTPGGLIGASTGFRDLDDITHGLHAGDLIIVAARPSMGKTLLGLNIAEHLAVQVKKTVLVFSMEMSGEQLLERSISSLGNVLADKIKSGTFNSIEHERIINVVSLLSCSNLIIDDRSTVTIADIRTKCRRVKQEYDLALVVVDYIGLMTGEGENENLKIASISRGLKLLARDLNVPIIALSQLNRGVEQRNNKRPTMSDLRQSGAIEQDADLILFIYRDEVYEPLTPNKGIAEIIISKHRNGNIGTINLKFNGNYCRFENFDGIYVPVKLTNTQNKNWKNGYED
jgi:replicative DNA helicase